MAVLMTFGSDGLIEWPISRLECQRIAALHATCRMSTVRSSTGSGALEDVVTAPDVTVGWRASALLCGSSSARRGGDPGQSAHGIVEQARLDRSGIAADPGRAGGRHLLAFHHQPVLDVVEIDACPVGGEIAVGVMAEARRTGAGNWLRPLTA